MFVDELIEHSLSKAGRRKLTDVRAGLGYTCVMLDDNACGLAYTFRNELGSCCSILSTAGNLNGKNAVEIIPWAKHKNLLQSAIGLATINAVLNRADTPWDIGNVTSAFVLSKSDTFGMVGHFGPILQSVRAQTQNVYVFEQNVREGSGLYPSNDIPNFLPQCDLVVVTATSIINHTIDNVLAHCNNAREVCMIGPSTPLCPEVFRDYKVTLLAGSVVTNPELILQIVSQGGGTMAMKPAIKQVLVRI